MSWIEEIDDSQWTGELKELRPAVSDPETGKVDNIMSVHSIDVGSMDAHLKLYEQAMRPTETLSKADREMIAIVVSKLNDCNY